MNYPLIIIVLIKLSKKQAYEKRVLIIDNLMDH